ncbi:45470_t:CDS:1, partial [Gigaspora margarita]
MTSRRKKGDYTLALKTLASETLTSKTLPLPTVLLIILQITYHCNSGNNWLHNYY